jgi:hypothetical protein
MPEYARAATFEADAAAAEALVNEINSSEGPPEGIPATRVTVLFDRAGGKLIVATRFASEEDLRKGSETLEGMSPPSDAGNVRRISVDQYEVLLEREG